MNQIKTFSTIDLPFCKQYLRIDEDFIEDDEYIKLCIEAVKHYIIEYSEMTIEKLDSISYVTIIMLKMMAEMYSSKTTQQATYLKTDFLTTSLLSKLRHYNV